MGLGRDCVLHYNPKDHKGFDSVYTTVIRKGRPVVVDDWMSLEGEALPLHAMTKTQ
jgi:hypothetical protein